MRDLKFICVQPDDSNKAIVLIFTPAHRERNTEWQKVIDLYPEAEFAFYKDQDNISSKLSVYIPIIRPYTLWRYWKDFPDMKDKAVFYCDCDILFTENFNISNYIDDDICYLSDTNSYINASYFDSKERDVLPIKLSSYTKIDVLQEATSLTGINRQIAEANNMNSGGAQYLLKNIDVIFWEKMIKDTLSIRTYLLSVNQIYFENESKGFQSWCADMWGLLWGLWFRNHETRVIPEMDFAWATDSIEKVERLGIFHNAGVASSIMDGIPYFYKGHYHQGSDPTLDPHLQTVIEQSSHKGTGYYAKRLLQLKEKYNLNY
jgi:hypothetical protein